MKYRAVGIEEKRTLLRKEGIPWPKCKCHDIPKQWSSATDRPAGGTWHCREVANKKSKELMEKRRALSGYKRRIRTYRCLLCELDMTRQQLIDHNIKEHGVKVKGDKEVEMTPEEYGDLVTGTKLQRVDLDKLFNEDWITIEEILVPDTVNIDGKTVNINDVVLKPGEVLEIEESREHHYHYYRAGLDSYHSVCYDTDCHRS